MSDKLFGSRIAGGNSAVGRRAWDFYQTPPEATLALLNFLGIPKGATIQLQRYGFSRESATYIKAHQAQYVVIDDDGNVHIKNSMEQCGDAEVVRQIPDIRFNTPELFID